jgi:coenzyme PQQ synthesis protein D (PqqD)
MSADNNMQPTEIYAAITETTVISRNASVLTAEVEGEIVMMSIEKGHYFGFDDIASDIWNRIEPPCSFAALVDQLVADYEADRVTIAADVQTLLGRMAAQNVVRLA